MDRRSFIMALAGGLAAAGTGGIAAAQAAQPRPVPAPGPQREEVASELAEGIDQTDAEFSQYYYRRPRYYRRRYYRPRYYVRPRYYRPRYYARPRRRVYYY